MDMIELENNRNTRPEFRRMKAVLSCASDDPARAVLSKVLVEGAEGGGIEITATDGKRLRRDRFGIDAKPGVYEIKANTGKTVLLARCEEELVFPNYRQAIPGSDEQSAYALAGRGRQFVLRAAAGLGCYLDPALVELGEDESVVLHLQKDDLKLGPVLARNEDTVLVVMPLRLDQPWVRQLEEIQAERLREALERQEEEKTRALAA